MLAKRIIPCLDVMAGKLTKGIKFKDNKDIGDPVEMAALYYEGGADELVFYDITASHEQRNIIVDVVRNVAKVIFIPFMVGGGLRTVADIYTVLEAGADKVSLNSAAVQNPNLLTEGARQFGSQCIVMATDVLRVPVSATIPSGYEVYINGGRQATGIDALAWSKQAQERGAGEICLNSIDADGTQAGYELDLTLMVSQAVKIPVIASGGAGKPEHLADVLTKAKADAALVASITHYGHYTIKELKQYLTSCGILVRST